jgi:hypothetical protein
MKKDTEEIQFTTATNTLQILNFVWNHVWTISSVKENVLHCENWSDNLKEFFFLVQGIMKNIQLQQWMTTHFNLEDGGNTYLQKGGNTDHMHMVQKAT